MSKLKTKIKIALTLILSFSPVITFAQGQNLNSVIISIAQLIQGKVIPIVIGIALLMFLWGVMKYGLASSEEDRKSSIHIIINGIIVLFVMVAVWGLVYVIASLFNINLNGGRTFLQNKTVDTDSIIIR